MTLKKWSYVVDAVVVRSCVHALHVGGDEGLFLPEFFPVFSVGEGQTRRAVAQGVVEGGGGVKVNFYRELNVMLHVVCLKARARLDGSGRTIARREYEENTKYDCTVIVH